MPVSAKKQQQMTFFFLPSALATDSFKTINCCGKDKFDQYRSQRWCIINDKDNLWNVEAFSTHCEFITVVSGGRSKKNWLLDVFMWSISCSLLSLVINFLLDNKHKSISHLFVCQISSNRKTQDGTRKSDH